MVLFIALVLSLDLCLVWVCGLNVHPSTSFAFFSSAIFSTFWALAASQISVLCAISSDAFWLCCLSMLLYSFSCFFGADYCLDLLCFLGFGLRPPLVLLVTLAFVYSYSCYALVLDPVRRWPAGCLFWGTFICFSWILPSFSRTFLKIAA